MNRLVGGEDAGDFGDIIGALGGALGGGGGGIGDLLGGGGGGGSVISSAGSAGGRRGGDLGSAIGGLFGGGSGGSPRCPSLVGKLGAFAGKAVGALKGEPAPAAHRPMGGTGGRPVPGRLPAPNTDPSKGWWEMLTTGQGIGTEAAEALLHAIDEGGPQGTREILASYERLLAPTLARAVKVQAADRMRTLLETLWHMRAEKGWEREAGGPSDAAEPGAPRRRRAGGEAGVPTPPDSA